jgi:hypothetical protein
MVGLRLLHPISARTGGRLARKVDKFLDTRILFEAGMNEIVCAHGIYFEVGFFSGRLCDPGDMKDLVHVFYRLVQRPFVRTVPVDRLDGEAPQPL